MKIVDESEIPKDAVQMHMYDPRDVLMPRGSMQKESIGPYLLGRLKGNYDQWTDVKYGDNPSVSDLIKYLHTNLMGEVEQAWLQFIDEVTTGLNSLDLLLVKMSVITAAKPEYDSVYIKWFIDTITSDQKMFVEAISFIDKFDRRSPEFAYFTNIHIKTVGCNEKYDQMMEDASDQTTELGKLFKARSDLG